MTRVVNGYQPPASVSLAVPPFAAAYGPGAGNLGWYAMDVEFKFADEGLPSGSTPRLSVKQARPYPGRGQ